ncbi:MAG TPA: transporter substrate-binding domain-containing protein [Candidatus Atribacteria bacterium]|nr:transporter substrate-binding domain-containing protein [Candidatus Atribacteria bacterium]
MKKILVMILALALGLTIAGCGGKSETMSKIQKEGKIVWGTNAEFAPFEMRSGDKVIGVDAEIAKKVAEKLGVELVVEDMDFGGLISALNAKQIDFIGAGFTVNAEREEQVLFTKKYFKAVQVIIVKEDNTDINGPDDLADKKVGVQENTTGDFIASDELVSESGEVIRFMSPMEAVLDLKNSRIDAIVIDNLPAQYLVAQNPGLKILEEKAGEDEEYAMAVRKGDDDLKKVIDEVLEELIASGQIDEWVEEYSLLD